MGSLSRHLRAMQAAAAVTVTTVALTALPLLAADQYDESYFGSQVIQTFQKLGAASSDMYSNASLESSSFDFAAYFSDTCFRPTEFDMPGCKEKFGPYSDLKQTYISGRLASIFIRSGYMKGAAALVPQAEDSVSSSSSSKSSSESLISPNETMTTPASMIDNRKDRASDVWALCVQKFPERSESTVCYQRNIRLIMERTEEVTSDLVY